MFIITKYKQSKLNYLAQSWLVGLNKKLQPIYTVDRFSTNVMHFKSKDDAIAINDMAKGNIQIRRFELVK